MIRRAAVFLSVFALLQSLYSISGSGSLLARFVIDEVTVKFAVRLIQLFDPATGVIAVGSRLKAPGGGINIINGCEGVDVMLLLLAAMLVAPISLRSKLIGSALGMLVVFALNQVRVIGLFYAYRMDRGLFDMLHGVAAPLMLIVAVSGYFLLWLQWHGPTQHNAPQAQ